MITDAARLQHLLAISSSPSLRSPNQERVEREDRIVPAILAEMRRLGTFG
jgi:hypothetical protein